MIQPVPTRSESRFYEQRIHTYANANLHGPLPNDGGDHFYSGKTPEAADVLLLIEVSDSSLAFDQGVKLNLYARYGVAEYWVVDVEGRRVVTYREPATKAYGRTLEFTAADTVTPQAFPDIKIAVGEIFGQSP